MVCLGKSPELLVSHVEPQRVRFDVADRSEEKWKDSDFKMRDGNGLVYGNFRIKDMEKFRRKVEDKDGNSIQVPAWRSPTSRRLPNLRHEFFG
jgi:hypothetical protein